jgi:hypothetical protein
MRTRDVCLAFVLSASAVTAHAPQAQDRAMDFSANDEDMNGAPILRRIRFFPLARSVRQLIELSSDGGKTWRTGFRRSYVRTQQP